MQEARIREMALAQKQKKEAARGIQVFVINQNVPSNQYLTAADSVIRNAHHVRQFKSLIRWDLSFHGTARRRRQPQGAYNNICCPRCSMFYI